MGGGGGGSREQRRRGGDVGQKKTQGFSLHGTPFPPLGGGHKQTRISVRERARRIPPEPAWAVRPTCDV